jgi:hypothetical protein
MQTSKPPGRQSLDRSDHDRPSRHAIYLHKREGGGKSLAQVTIRDPASRTCLLTRKRKRGNSGKTPFEQQRAGFQQKQNLESAGHEVHTD